MIKNFPINEIIGVLNIFKRASKQFVAKVPFAFHDESCEGVIMISDGFLEYLMLCSIDLHLNCC